MSSQLTTKTNLPRRVLLSLTIKLLFTLFFIQLITTLPSHAMEANGCPDYQEPSLSIKQLIITPRFNDTVDLASLRQLVSQGGPNLTSTRHETPVGLTAASLKLDTSYEVHTSSSPDDVMVCAQITAMEVNFGFDDTTVYIAHEIPHGSCSYQTVLTHELQHVKTDRMLIDATIPMLPRYIRKALDQIGVIRATSAETAERQLKTMVSAYMKTLGSNLSEVRKSQQATIDTEGEYDRISDSCDGALGELIAASRGNQ